MRTTIAAIALLLASPVLAEPTGGHGGGHAEGASHGEGVGHPEQGGGRGDGGGGEQRGPAQHVPVWGRQGVPDREHSGGYGRPGFGRPTFGFIHGQSSYNRWRNRNQGNACRIMGYRFGCRSIADGVIIILNLDDEVYCYRRFNDYDRPRAIVCPSDWYNY